MLSPESEVDMFKREREGGMNRGVTLEQSIRLAEDVAWDERFSTRSDSSSG